MVAAYNEGDTVQWDWGEGVAKGDIKTVHTRKITKTIKGTEVTREADDDCPAYTIEQDDGDEVLKSHSEVRKAS
ncbi:MAG: DUF2945 domain-containing protein [Pseudomonadota bacterium]